jgi:hypothetical protein
MLGSFVAPGSRRSSDPVIGPSAALVVAAISATESVKLWRGQQDDCCAPIGFGEPTTDDCCGTTGDCSCC